MIYYFLSNSIDTIQKKNKKKKIQNDKKKYSDVKKLLFFHCVIEYDTESL
jgi:hypothetical protein